MVTNKGDTTLSPFAAPAESRSSLRQALPQILAVCVKNVLLLGFGMTLGFPTILIPSLSEKNEKNPEEAIFLGEEGISWIGSINLICVPIGAMLSGVVTQPIGRKRAMQLVNIPFLAAWLLFHFSTEVWQIFMALCITGFTGGLLEAPTLTYVAEITEPRYRGILSSTAGIAVIVGVLSQFLLGTFFKWRLVAVINCMAPIAAFILLFFVPESPYWLILKKRNEKAKKSIAWLRGWKEIDEILPEYDDIRSQMSYLEKHLTLKEKCGLFTKKKFYWPFLLVSFGFFLSQFCGSYPIQIFAIEVFHSLNSPIDEYYATLAMGVAEVLGCVVCTCLVHHTGKRVINFFSLLGCAVCFTIVAAYAYYYKLNTVILKKAFETNSHQTENNWIPTTFVIGSAFCTRAGIKHLPWMLTGEVYANDVKSTASGFSGAVSAFLGFVSIKIFFSLVSLLTFPGVFAFYSVVCTVGTIVLYFVLPETEGKTLFEITEHFARKSKLTNKVTRIKDMDKKIGNDNEAYVKSNEETKL